MSPGCSSGAPFQASPRPASPPPTPTSPTSRRRRSGRRASGCWGRRLGSASSSGRLAACSGRSIPACRSGPPPAWPSLTVCTACSCFRSPCPRTAARPLNWPTPVRSVRSSCWSAIRGCCSLAASCSCISSVSRRCRASWCCTPTSATAGRPTPWACVWAGSGWPAWWSRAGWSGRPSSG